TALGSAPAGGSGNAGVSIGCDGGTSAPRIVVSGTAASEDDGTTSGLQAMNVARSAVARSVRRRRVRWASVIRSRAAERCIHLPDRSQMVRQVDDAADDSVK